MVAAGQALPSGLPTAGVRSGGLPSPYLHGEMTAKATHVVMTFSNGQKVSAAIIAPHTASRPDRRGPQPAVCQPSSR